MGHVTECDDTISRGKSDTWSWSLSRDHTERCHWSRAGGNVTRMLAPGWLLPGMEYWGRNWAKFVPKAAGSWPPWKPLGNCWLAGISPWWPLAEVTSRDKMLRSDICSLCNNKQSTLVQCPSRYFLFSRHLTWATGGILAKLAGSLDTSDFMSDRSSSSWLRT